MKQMLLCVNLLITVGLAPGALAQGSGSAETSCDPLHAGPLSCDRPAYASSYSAWKISLAPVFASQALDSYSSYGLREANPLLAGTDQRFNGLSLVTKLGVVGALVGVEYLLIRKHPESSKLLWKLNVASAAVTGGIAAHNFAIR